MPELKQLDAGHAPAVLAFELANRAYFAASISDRGDEFYGGRQQGVQGLCEGFVRADGRGGLHGELSDCQVRRPAVPPGPRPLPDQ